jgi:hypothetical protein
MYDRIDAIDGVAKRGRIGDITFDKAARKIAEVGPDAKALIVEDDNIKFAMLFEGANKVDADEAATACNQYASHLLPPLRLRRIEFCGSGILNIDQSRLPIRTS